jgi:predicted HTH domain antitoxin
MATKTISFTAPDILGMEIEASSSIGYYDNKSEFLRDATRTLLAARKDLRIAIACELFNKNKISIGKAVEISGLHFDEFKKILSKTGNTKRGSRTVSEMKKRSKNI